jgi:hypothetical protein
MIEILQNLGLPAIAVLALVIIGAVLQQYLSHHLVKQREKNSRELETIQPIHSKRLEAVNKMEGLIAEFQHCVYHIEAGDIKAYKDSLEQGYKELRSFARQNSLLLGKEYEMAVYNFTDAGKTVLTKNFDKANFRNAMSDLIELKIKTLKTIPQIPKDLIENETLNNAPKTKARHKPK